MPTVLSRGCWSVDVDATVSVQRAAAAADSVSSVSTHCSRARVLLLSRRVALDVASVDVRLSVGRGCVSLLVHRAVMRLVVSGRGWGCVGPAYNCRVRRRVRMMVLLLSRRLLLVTAAVNACLSVGRRWSLKRAVNKHARRLMYAACRLAVVALTRAH